MTRREWSVLFLGKEKDGHTEKAADFCRRQFASVRVQVGKWGDPLPADARSPGWDCITHNRPRLSLIHI